MYVTIEKETQKAYFFREKVRLSAFLGVSTATIRRKEDKNSWEHGEFTVYNVVKSQIKSGRGGKREKK